jgi:hypothetical protein
MFIYFESEGWHTDCNSLSVDSRAGIQTRPLTVNLEETR